MPPSFLRMQVKMFNLFDKFNSFNRNLVQRYNKFTSFTYNTLCLLVKVGRENKIKILLDFLTATTLNKGLLQLEISTVKFMLK